jgi:hypothetical protein
MKKRNGKQREAAFARPQSAPNVRCSSPPPHVQPKQSLPSTDLDIGLLISSSSAQQLITNAQLCIAKIDKMRRSTIMLPKLSPAPHATRATARTQIDFHKVLNLDSSSPTDIADAQPSVPAAESFDNSAVSDSKPLSSSKKLRPVSAALASRSAASRVVSVQAMSPSSALSIMHLLTSPSSHTETAATNPKRPLELECKTIHEHEARSKLSKMKLLSLWKHACSRVTNCPDAAVSLLMPILQEVTRHPEEVQAPEIVLAAAIIVRCSEVSSRIQELQDWCHNLITKMRKISGQFGNSDGYTRESRSSLFEIQKLFEDFSLTQSECVCVQQSVQELHMAHSAVLVMEVQDSCTSFEASALCSATVHSADELMSRLLTLQQGAQATFNVASSAFVSCFLETCTSMEHVAMSLFRTIQTKSMVMLPLSHDEYRVSIQVESFLESCTNLPGDLSRFVFIDHSDRLLVQTALSKAAAACSNFSQFYQKYVVIVENLKNVTVLKKSFEESLQDENFLDADCLLREIEQICRLLPEKSSIDIVSQCTKMFVSAESQFEKHISEVRLQIQLAQQNFDGDWDHLTRIHEHIHAAQFALSQIRCTVPESLTLNDLVAKVKSWETRRYWQAKSSVQLGLSSVCESLNKFWEDTGKAALHLENLAKLGETIDSLRGIMEKFGITDESIINQVLVLQAKIDDYSVLASGAPLEHVELIYSNCVNDFQHLLDSEELYQLEHGINMLKQIQYRLKRFQNKSADTLNKENSSLMYNRCSQEISRIELLRGRYLEHFKLEVASLKELLSGASAQDESDSIPQLHFRVLNVRLVASAIDNEEALGEILDLCRKSALVAEHRDNWLSSKVLVSLSEAESVFRNHQSSVPDLIAAIDKLKQNDIVVSKIMNPAVQLAIASKIEKTGIELKRSLVLIQDDQRDKKSSLESVIIKLKIALASYNGGCVDEGLFVEMLDLQSSGIDLRSRIHIDAGNSFKEFENLSSFVSEIFQRRERLSSATFEAQTLCTKFELWLSKITDSHDYDVNYGIDLKPLLMPLHNGSRVIVSLHLYGNQDNSSLTIRLQSLIRDTLVIIFAKIKDFLLIFRQDIAALQKFLAANLFARAVSIVDTLKISINCHQILLLHLKNCCKVIAKFYKIQMSSYLIESRLLEFDLCKLIQQFDAEANELPLLRAGILAQGEKLLNDAYDACVARHSIIAREKLRLSILSLQKVCDPQRWKLVSDELILLERRSFAEAAAAAALCKMSQAQGKLHNYDAGLALLISACQRVEHWNLNKKIVTSTFEYMVCSALELLSQVCSASNEIWDRLDCIISKGLSSAHGQSPISAGLDIVQHRNLLHNVVYKRMLGTECIVWDDLLQADKSVRANLWNSSFLQLSPHLVEMTKELNIIIEKLEARNDYIAQRSEQVMTALSSGIKTKLLDSGLLSAARCTVCDAIRERRLADAASAARETIVSVVNSGVSPDYITSLYAEYSSLADCMAQLEIVEPSFRIPYQGVPLPHVSWSPPQTVKLDAETTCTLVSAIAGDLNACLEACCCALAEKDMENLELEIISPDNRNNIGFLHSAAALAPGAFFEVLLARHCCQLGIFQTVDGLTLLHFASCYCNEQSLEVILENGKKTDILFTTDCHGRNVLHFLFSANREYIGVSECALLSIFDTTYAKWVSLQECLSKLSSEPRSKSSLCGFHTLSRHTPRHKKTHLDLDVVLRILQRDFYQCLEKLTAPDYALNNFMHSIACRRIKSHRASKTQQSDTKTRRSGLFGNLHSGTAFLRDDKAVDQVVGQEKNLRDLSTLHQLLTIFQKPCFLALLNNENLDGMTPLLLACSHGNSTIVALFILQLGADVACYDLLQRTPLHFAADCNDRMSQQLLLSCPGINASAIDHRKQTALFRLASSGHHTLFADLTAFLRNLGAAQVCQRCRT